ncbi:hypothetical protein ARSEF4850_008517, partial [Beauveria asiatica]
MAESTAGENAVVEGECPATPKRSTRLAKPSEKAKGVTGSDDVSPTKTAKRPTTRASRANQAPANDAESDNATIATEGTGGTDTGAAALLHIVLKELKDIKDASVKQQNLIEDLREQVVEAKQEIRDTRDELKYVREQLEAVTAAAAASEISPRPSYAEIARTPPTSYPSNIPSFSSNTTTSGATDLLYCTVDVSRVDEALVEKTSAGAVRTVIETEARLKLERANWRCRAVTKDRKNPNRIRIACRDEVEHDLVKQLAHAKLPTGARVMRDELYPVKVDNVNRFAVVDENSNVKPEATASLGEENEVQVAKVAWLSRRDNPKAYGSMVVYLTKVSDARRILREGFFYAGGESGPTERFERRPRPEQCYNCQEIGHKAFQCAKSQKGITTEAVWKSSPNVRSAMVPMKHLAEAAEDSSHPTMNKQFQIVQLNVKKQGSIHDSLMNDDDLRNTAVILIQEPQARNIAGRLLTTPMAHNGWTKMTPSVWSEGRWAIRSMLWINESLEAEQLSTESPDLTAAMINLQDKSILVVSAYVAGMDNTALRYTCAILRSLIITSRRRAERPVEILIAGDFNRHDQLWGGDDVSMDRQGEADQLVELMGEYSLSSLLPRGTKTWHDWRYETTIDLVLASEGLAESKIRCTTDGTDHGSDHYKITTSFDISMPEIAHEPRFLFKNTPWKEVNNRIRKTLHGKSTTGDVQADTDQLMSGVLEALHALTPKSKSSPYAKRWWTSDLSQLRAVQSFWRNRARAQRRAGRRDPELEDNAKGATKQYHDAIRQRKQTHWEEFLADNDNIWEAAKYMRSNGSSAFGKVPHLKKADGTYTSNKQQQATEMLETFFPPLPENIEEEGDRPERESAVPMPSITMEEVERQLHRAKSWKAPGEDGLPAWVWKQVWPVVRHWVLAIFRNSVEQGQVPSQWRHAKIIPLKKPDKADYTIAKAWRPISLLSTLGKLLESVVAERLSFVVETYGLLPANHFGARKQRSAEQALILLQEQILYAWRAKRVLSLISFDVKGAYNGVCKGRLVQRMKARGIPEAWTRWVEAFCSSRTATIQVNGQTSDTQELPQAGLPQGSPLSPILFLFYNADLVQRRITWNGGS